MDDDFFHIYEFAIEVSQEEQTTITEVCGMIKIIKAMLNGKNLERESKFLLRKSLATFFIIQKYYLGEDKYVKR
jgi:hypothetical protein